MFDPLVLLGRLISYASFLRRLSPVLLLGSLIACAASLPAENRIWNPPVPAILEAEDDQVIVAYLGSGGLWIQWRGEVVLTAPYLSNAGMVKQLITPLEPDYEMLERVMAALPGHTPCAVLVGHSHYDHIADIPALSPYFSAETLYVVNRSGANILASTPTLKTHIIEDHNPATFDALGEWIEVSEHIRVMPIVSNHADHMRGIHLYGGEVEEPWSPEHPYRTAFAYREGQPHAFLVDLLDDSGEVAYRIHYQDAASDAPLGFIPDVLNERPVDLEVLTMPGYHLVDRYPNGVLEHHNARHALVIHYEDFFRPIDETLSLVPVVLNQKRANAFTQIVESNITAPDIQQAAPLHHFQGRAGQSWSMPLPGEWLLFDAPVQMVAEAPDK